MIVGIDTMTAVWGLRHGGPAVAERDLEKREKARALIERLDRDGADIVLPAVAVAELLVPLTGEEESAFLVEVTRRCVPATFDLRAATLAAQLYRNHAIRDEYRQGEGPTRMFRADTLIVASARGAGATRFYTDDGRCRKLATLAGMEGLGLADHDEPLFRATLD